MFHRRTGMRIAALRFHWVALPEELAGIGPNGLDDPGPLAKLLWGYVDARDAATACRLAVESEQIGFEAFNVTAADTLCTAPTAELIRRHLPDTEVASPIPGTATGFSIEKAKDLLGWEPRHSWRTSN